MAESRRKPHAITIPYPYQGHINLFVSLAVKLASRGFTITFVNTQFVDRRISRAQMGTECADIFAGARDSGLDIRYAMVSDGFPLGFDRTLNHDQFVEGYKDHCIHFIHDINYSPSIALTLEVLSFHRSRRPNFPSDLEQLSAPLLRASEGPLKVWCKSLGDELFGMPAELRLEALRARHHANSVFIESLAEDVIEMAARAKENAEHYRAQSKLLQAADERCAELIKDKEDIAKALEDSETKLVNGLRDTEAKRLADLAAREEAFAKEKTQLQAEADNQRAIYADIVYLNTLADGIREARKRDPPADYSLFLFMMKKAVAESPVDPTFSIPVDEIRDAGVDLSFFEDPGQLCYPEPEGDDAEGGDGGETHGEGGDEAENAPTV